MTEIDKIKCFGFFWYTIVMTLPTKNEARVFLHEHVTDTYQRFHAEMVGTAVEGYAHILGEDTQLWWLTGFLHDIDYQAYPSQHPGPSLVWFAQWGYPQELIHAVEAHALGFNGFTTKPQTPLAKALLSSDEICGIFYAYQKLNPIAFKDMKISSLQKRITDARFAPGINRDHILRACEDFDIKLETHIENLIGFLGSLDHEKDV